MKLVVLSATYLFLFFSFSYAQKITKHDLIGIWKEIGTDVNAYRTFDNKTMTETFDSGSPSPLPYFLDNSHSITVIHFYKKPTSNVTISMYYLVKIEKGNILKMQGDGKTIPRKWEKETEINTGTWERVK